MGKLITEIQHLPVKGQEFILSGLASDYIPIEIDGIVYVIPKEVNTLIKGLAEVLHDKKTAEGDVLSSLEKLKK